MKIAARAKAAQPFHAMSIGERAGILQAEGRSIAKLSLGEPDFGAPPAVREEMRRVMDGRSLPSLPRSWDCSRCVRPLRTSTGTGTV